MESQNIDQQIISQLTERGDDILYVFFRKNSEGPEVALKRNQIIQELNTTVLKGWTDPSYTATRLKWYSKAVENIKFNALKTDLTLDQINLTDKLSLNGYELNHSCQFPNFIRAVLKQVPSDLEISLTPINKKRPLMLRQHQEVSRRYAINLNENDFESDTRWPLTPYRGALLYHDMGTGKTLTGVHVAIGWIDQYRLPMLKTDQRYNYGKGNAQYSYEKRGKVVFMFLKRLESTWNSSIYRYLNEAYDLEGYFLKYFYLTDSAESIFISNELIKWYNHANINNMPEFKEQIIRDGKFVLIKHALIESFIKDHIVYIFADPNGVENRINNFPLKQNLVIIDEVHNVVSYIHGALLVGPGRSPGKIGGTVYEWFMSSVDTKIIGLSGTPIINKPSELLVLANILRGKMVICGDNYESLFSLDLEKIQQIVFDENNEIVNPELLSRRLTGLVSRKIRDASPDYPVTFWSTVFPWNGQTVPWESQKTTLFNSTSDSIIQLSIGTIRRINIPLSEKQYIAYQKTRDRPSSFSEGGAFNTLLGMASYPLDSSLLYEIKLSSSSGNKLSCNLKEILRLIMYNTSYSLFLGKTNSGKIDDSALLRDKGDAEKFANFICNNLSEMEPDLYNPTVNAVLTSEREPGKLHDEAVFRALELYKGIDTKRDYFVNRFVYNKATVKDDSPKIARMLETILDPNNRDLHFIYAHTIIYGAFHIEGYLQANGYELYLFDIGDALDPNAIKIRAKEEIAKLKEERAKGRKFYVKYAKNYQFIRSGNAVYGPNIEDKQMIDTIDHIFNSDENKEGDLIKVLIGTKKAKEGLDLRHVRQVYIMDPWWNMVSVEQAMGRAIRFLSHYRVNKDRLEEGFPSENDRYVKIDLLIGVFSGNQISRIRSQSSNNQTTTVDERALTTALNKLEASRRIDEVLNKSAFDCGLYKSVSECPTVIECVNRFETIETGLSYVPSIQNEPTDLEYNLTRTLKEEDYLKVTLDHKTYYRSKQLEEVEVQFETEGGVRTQKADLILYEDYMESGILIPAYAIVSTQEPLDEEGDASYLQIKYPAFKISGS